MQRLRPTIGWGGALGRLESCSVGVPNRVCNPYLWCEVTELERKGMVSSTELRGKWHRLSPGYGICQSSGKK